MASAEILVTVCEIWVRVFQPAGSVCADLDNIAAFCCRPKYLAREIPFLPSFEQIKSIVLFLSLNPKYSTKLA